MAIEFSQHRNILLSMEEMNLRLKEHELSINLSIDRYWYIQKAEELQELQSQIEKATQRLYELRVMLHTESHKVYNRLKADNRTLLKVEGKRRRSYKTLNTLID